MSGLNRTPGKRVYVSKRTAGSNPALSARTSPANSLSRARLATQRPHYVWVVDLGSCLRASSPIPETCLKPLSFSRPPDFFAAVRQ